MAMSDEPGLKEPVSERDHALGPEGAPVTVVEYGDYECPYSAQAHETIKAITRGMGSRLRYVFRNFPLTEIHPDAMETARAAEAAAAQGKFWEMHSAIFEHQDALCEKDLVAQAEVIGVDVPRLVKDMKEGRHDSRIRDDLRSGARSGVEGTPTFFVNGVRYAGSHDLETFLAFLKELAGERSDKVA